MAQMKQEMRECSFKPKINKKESSQDRRGGETLRSDQSESCCLRLFNLAKRKAKKVDKPTNDYEYERNENQCTFNPNLVKPDVDIKPVNVSKATINKAIERIRKGREERLRVKAATSTNKDDWNVKIVPRKPIGDISFKQSEINTNENIEVKPIVTPLSSNVSPYSLSARDEIIKSLGQQSSKSIEDINNKKEILSSVRIPETNKIETNLEAKQSLKPLSDFQSIEQSQQNSQAQIEEDPLLFIDVNLGDYQKRIVVYKGDNANNLAEEFAKENSKYLIIIGLDNTAKEKLEALIEAQMEQLLEKIEEEVQSDDEAEE